MENNSVEKPSHYTTHPSGIECIEIIQHMTYSIGAAMKYLWRAGLKEEKGLILKEKKIEDLRKAIKYITFEIEKIEKYE